VLVSQTVRPRVVQPGVAHNTAASQHGRLAEALRPGKECLRNQRPQRNGGRIDNTFLVAEIDTVFFKRPSKSIAVHDLCQRQLVVLRQRTTEDEAASNAVGGVKDRDLP